MSSVFNICGGEDNSFTPAPRKIVPQGTLEITENGEYDVSEFANALVAVAGSGGGGTVSGSFHTNTSSGVQAIEIPYEGDGYPLAIIIKHRGIFQDEDPWKALVAPYAIGWGCLCKTYPDLAMEYRGGVGDQGFSLFCIKANNGSTIHYDGTSYASIGAQVAPAGERNKWLYFANKQTMKVFVKATQDYNYGLVVDADYDYTIIYSE